MTGLTVTLGVARDVAAVTRTTPGGKVILIRPAVTGGQTITTDLRDAPHVLISGTTGSGKSVAIHNVLTELLATQTTDTLGLVLVDPKRVELSDYRGLPHVAGPAGAGHIYRTPLESVVALEWTLTQVERRFAAMERERVRDASLIAQGVWEGWGLGARYLLVVIDELADLVFSARSILSPAQRRALAKAGRMLDLEITLARILQLGRAAGVHCVLATQRPSVDVVTGVIKTNVPTRLCFALQNAIDSRVALGQRGAEELEGKGDALWLPVGARTPVRLQGAMP